MSPATTASATIANPQNFKMPYDAGRRDGRAFADHRSCHGGRMEVDFSRVIDALPGLVWTALPDGYIDFVNQRWCEYTGLSHENAYGLGWQTAICPEDLPGLLERWRSMLASGVPGEIEARLKRFDGEYRRFLICTSALRDATGQIVKWCGVSTDLEDRRRAEEALRARERVRAIVEDLPAMVTLMTPDGEFADGNRHMFEYFDASLEELKRRPTTYSFHPDDRPSVDARWKESVETGVHTITRRASAVGMGRTGGFTRVAFRWEMRKDASSSGTCCRLTSTTGSEPRWI